MDKNFSFCGFVTIFSQVPGFFLYKHKDIFQTCVHLITQLLQLVGSLGYHKPDKSHQLGGHRYSNWPVRNRCVIEVFGGVFVLSKKNVEFSVGIGLLS